MDPEACVAPAGCVLSGVLERAEESAGGDTEGNPEGGGRVEVRGSSGLSVEWLMAVISKAYLSFTEMARTYI